MQKESLSQSLEALSGTLNQEGLLPDSANLSSTRLDLLARRGSLLKRFASAQQSLERQDRKLSEISRLFNYDFFVGRYLSLALKQGITANSPAVQKFKDFINAETFSASLLGNLQARAIEINLSMLSLEGEHLKELLKEFSASYESAKKTVQASPLVDTQKSRILGDIEKIHQPVLNDYADSIESYSPQETAQAMHEKKVGRFTYVCARQALGNACRVYGLLKGLSSEKILSYDLKAITELETMWKQVEERN